MFDAIVVPGGGVRPGWEIPEWSKRRLDRAAELYQGEYVILLSAGTTHRSPPVDERGFTICESVAGAKYLISKGIPADRILTETHSYDTIGNAFFARVIHTDPRRLRRLLVVTSEFHMPRTRAIFDWLFALTPSFGYELVYDAVSDAGIDTTAASVRQAKEARSLEGFRRTSSAISTLADAHRWLFTSHNAYSAVRPAFDEPWPEDLLALY